MRIINFLSSAALLVALVAILWLFVNGAWDLGLVGLLGLGALILSAPKQKGA